MATVTINYDGRNVLIKSILRSAILAGATQVATKNMSPLDKALEEVRSGKVTTIFTSNHGKKRER
ncbi:MAG: hypothetical protein FWG84_07325 [Bacteroidales bacterium]|nr:hypothetical protein [Bacteroidales bacterium]